MRGDQTEAMLTEWASYGEEAPRVGHRTIDDLNDVHDYADARVGSILTAHGLTT